MSQRTAQELVNGVRYLIKNVGSAPYRSGFSTDAETDSTLIPLLYFVNKAYREYSMAGFAEVDTDITLTSGVPEYTLPISVGRITSVTIIQGSGNYPSTNVTQPELKRRFKPNWRARTAGSPHLYYTQGQVLGFSRTPNFSGIARIRSSNVPFDMAFPNSIPSGVPVMHHDALAQLGAIYAEASDIDDPAAPQRIELLVSQFITNYPELYRLVKGRSIEDNVSPLGVLAGDTNAGGE